MYSSCITEKSRDTSRSYDLFQLGVLRYLRIIIPESGQLENETGKQRTTCIPYDEKLKKKKTDEKVFVTIFFIFILIKNFTVPALKWNVL